MQVTKSSETSRTARDILIALAEFNTYADSVAAARVYALTSPTPKTTMPPVPPAPSGKQSDDPPPPFLRPYPEKLSRQLNVTLFPLDITTDHWLRRRVFDQIASPLVSAGSPLAEWVSAFLLSTFKKMETLHIGHEGDMTGLSLHDPLCIWYLLAQFLPEYTMTLSEPEDMRVETSGQWTRGMCVVDGRDRKKLEDDGRDVDMEKEVVGDAGYWLGARSGNRIKRAVGSPGMEVFGKEMLERIFGLGLD